MTLAAGLRLLAAALALGGLAAAEPALSAHEMGSLQMTTTFHRDGSYRVDVAVEEERVSGFPRNRTPGETLYGPIAGFAAAVPPADRARLGPFLEMLAERSTLAFDGRPSPPTALSVDRPPPPADDPFAPLPKLTLHLEGAIPPGARTATWALDLVLGSFPIAFGNDGDAALSRQWLEGQRESRPFALSPQVVPPTPARALLRYLELGYRQILPLGTDAILFVLGILVVAPRRRPALAQLAAFAGAQALALALATYGLISLAPGALAPAIALSVVGVAVSNVLTPGIGAWRIALMAAFGLFHGLGFAEALRAAGLPRAGSLPALAGFDLGIATGLATVLAVAFLLAGLPYRGEPWYRRRVAIPASLVLLAIGLYESIERLVS